MAQATGHHRPWLAFTWAIPIGTLGGLIGLGGAEFRLPVLVGSLGYTATRAVPLNLAISLITVIVSLLIRSRTLSIEPLAPIIPAILSLIAGAVITAFYGTAWVGRLTNEGLERIILVLLVIIGIALLVEGFLPQEVPGLLPTTWYWRVLAGIIFGLGIGLVSSMLGVAGGELIIPTLVFAFGTDIKTAGTASLFVSLPVVLVGVVRYARRGAYADENAVTKTIVPMGIGSVIGAVIGGILAGYIPSAPLKVLLGIILNVSALRIFSGRRAH